MYSQVCSIMNIMKFQTEVKQILGTPDQGAWSQVHHFTPTQKEKFLKRGELILLVSLGEIDQGQPTSSVGREIISRFHEEYYGNLDKKPMAALEEAAKKVAKEKPKYFNQPEEISLIGLVLWKNIAYLVIYHRGQILLRRDGETVKLLETGNGQPQSASGFARPGDIFVLGTTDFFEKLPAAMIPSGLATEDLDRMVEIWGPVVHAREDQGRLGVAVVKVGPEEKQVKFVQPEPEEKKEKKKKLKFKPKLPKLNIKLDFLKKVSKRISTLSIAVGFLILLGVSIFFGWKKRQEQQKEEQVQNLSQQVEEQIATANSLRNLDPEESLKLLTQAEETNQELEKLNRAKAESYRQRMEEIKENLGEKALKPEMYYDLNLVGENIQVNSAYTNGQTALVLDTSGERLININLEEKSAEIIAGDSRLSSQGLVVFSQDRNYYVEDEIYWVEGEELTELRELDEDFVSAAADGWLGSLYLLDTAQEQIWKFPAITGGIGGERPWFNSTTGLDFSKLVDMGIDTNIWLLAENGQIYKYLSGDRQEFSLELPSGIGRAKHLAVAQEAERLVFWDESNKIIWLFSKAGSFVARQPVELEKVIDIGISFDGTKVYLFGIDKIYLVEL